MPIQFPTRLDSTAASEGRWFSIYDEQNQHYGDYKLGCTDETSPHYKLAIKRIADEAKRAMMISNSGSKKAKPVAKDEATTRRDNAKFFADLCLLDWANLPGDDEKNPTPYSEDAVVELFSTDDPTTLWLMDHIWKLSKDVTYFMPEAPAEKN